MRIFSIQNILLIALMMGAGGQGGNWLPASISHFLGTHAAVAASEKFDMGAILEKLRAQQMQVMQEQQRELMVATAGTGTTFDFTTNTADSVASPAAVAGAANLSPAVQAQVTQAVETVMAQMGKSDLLNLASELN